MESETTRRKGRKKGELRVRQREGWGEGKVVVESGTTIRKG